MNKYELTVVLSEKTTPAKKKAISAQIEKILKIYKGKILSQKDWGKIDLAYPIAKNTAGVFLFYLLELEGKSVKDLDQQLKLDKGIVRHLLVKEE